MANLFLDLPAPSGTGVGAVAYTDKLGKEKTITVHDPFVGTLNVEITLDDQEWASVATFVRPGKVTINKAAKQMRVRRSGVLGVSAPPNVDVGANDSGAQFKSLPAPVNNGLGAIVDVSALGTFNTVMVTGAFKGLVNILISEDGEDWTACMTFKGDKGTAPLQDKEFVAKFMRVERHGIPLSTSDPGLPIVSVGAINDPVTDADAPGSGVGIVIDIENLTSIVENLGDQVANLISQVTNQGAVINGLVGSVNSLAGRVSQLEAGTDHRSDSREPEGTAGGDLAGTYPFPRIKDNVVGEEEMNVYVSPPTIGTGAIQTFAHGLGKVPAIIFIAATAGHDGAGGPGGLMPTLVQGFSDATDLRVTCDAGAEYKVIAWG